MADMVERLVTKFFDGLAKGNVDRMLKQAKPCNVPTPALDKLKKLEKEREELDEIIAKYSSADED